MDGLAAPRRRSRSAGRGCSSRRTGPRTASASPLIPSGPFVGGRRVARRGVDLGPAAERDRAPSRRCRRRARPSASPVSPTFARRSSRTLPVAEELVLVAVDREDRVARPEPGGRGRRAGLDLEEPEADERRREPGDQREDQERVSEVHHDAGDEDDQLDGQRSRGRTSAGRRPVVAVLALELDEAADRQPVQRVERLALRAQDLRPRREADPELEDADAGQAGRDEVAELVDQDEAAEDRRRTGRS